MRGTISFTWKTAEIFFAFYFLSVASCGRHESNATSVALDTRMVVAAAVTPREKYPFLYGSAPPPIPDTPVDQLPRLPDFVIAPPDSFYHGKTTLLARIPYGHGPGQHGNDLSPKEGDFAEEYFSINAANCIVLTDAFNARLLIIGPDGKFVGAVENLWGLDGPVAFISDSVCVMQTGHPSPEERVIPYLNANADYFLGESVTVVNVISRSIEGDSRLPDPVSDTAYLPDWHPVSILGQCNRGEATYPPMQWRIGSAPISEAVDPLPGRGYAAVAIRVLGEAAPQRPKVEQLFDLISFTISDPDTYGRQESRTEYPLRSIAYAESKSDGRRYYLVYIFPGSVIGQSTDGRIFTVEDTAVYGYTKIGNDIAWSEEYEHPLSTECYLDDGQENPGAKWGELVHVSASPTGRVVWVYRTPRGVEIYKAERP